MSINPERGTEIQTVGDLALEFERQKAQLLQWLSENQEEVVRRLLDESMDGRLIEPTNGLNELLIALWQNEDLNTFSETYPTAAQALIGNLVEEQEVRSLNANINNIATLRGNEGTKEEINDTAVQSAIVEGDIVPDTPVVIESEPVVEETVVVSEEEVPEDVKLWIKENSRMLTDGRGRAVPFSTLHTLFDYAPTTWNNYTSVASLGFNRFRRSDLVKDEQGRLNHLEGLVEIKGAEEVFRRYGKKLRKEEFERQLEIIKGKTGIVAEEQNLEEEIVPIRTDPRERLIKDLAAQGFKDSEKMADELMQCMLVTAGSVPYFYLTLLSNQQEVTDQILELAKAERMYLESEISIMGEGNDEKVLASSRQLATILNIALANGTIVWTPLDSEPKPTLIESGDVINVNVPGIDQEARIVSLNDIIEQSNLSDEASWIIGQLQGGLKIGDDGIHYLSRRYIEDNFLDGTGAVFFFRSATSQLEISRYLPMDKGIDPRDNGDILITVPDAIRLLEEAKNFPSVGLKRPASDD